MQTRLPESAGFEIVQYPQKGFTRAVDRFTTHERMSCGDASVATFMERTELEQLYRVDGDFDALDHMTGLETAVNPSG